MYFKFLHWFVDVHIQVIPTYSHLLLGYQSKPTEQHHFKVQSIKMKVEANHAVPKQTFLLEKLVFKYNAHILVS